MSASTLPGKHSRSICATAAPTLRRPSANRPDGKVFARQRDRANRWRLGSNWCGPAFIAKLSIAHDQRTEVSASNPTFAAFAVRSSKCSGEIVAADHAVRRRPHMRRSRHGWWRDFRHAPRLQKREQDGERQAIVTRVRRTIERCGQIRLPRQRAESFAILADKPPEAPGWQLKLDESECGIGPGAGRDQPIDARHAT
jgi:hypothetical protein